MQITVEVNDEASNLDVFCAVFLSDEARKNAFKGGSTLSISYDSVFEDEKTELTVNNTWLKSPYYCGNEDKHNRIVKKESENVWDKD